MASRLSIRREPAVAAATCAATATYTSNPIFTHFRVLPDAEPTAIYRDGLWKMLQAERCSDRARATVCVCDKKALEVACRSRRRFEIALDVYRREACNLDKYRHPNIVTLLHGLEETPSSLAFAVERVCGTLESVLLACRPGPLCDSAASASPAAPEALEELELKYGLLQLTEALKFLHNVNHTFHRNVAPRSVFVTPGGLWKLGGMAFVDKLYQERNPAAHDPKLPLSAQPDLDFLPPEAAPHALHLDNAALSAAGDMFSFGLLICAVCNRRSLISTGGNLEKYATGIDQLTLLFKNMSHRLPPELVGAVQRMLTRDATQRIGAQSFALLKYFHDEDVMLLQNLASLLSKAPQQRADLFRKLRDCLPKLSRKVAYSHVLPVLLDNIGAVEYDVPVLYTYLALIRESSNIEFRSNMFSTLKNVVDGICTCAAAVTLLQNAEVLSAKLNCEELEALLLPMIIRALQSTSSTQHEAALKALPCVLQELDDGESETKRRVRDALIQLIELPSTPASLCAGVKAQCLSCLYLVTQHDLAMKFALEQLLEQQLQNAAVYQALVAHVKSVLETDVQLAYISDFALPALIRPLNYSEQIDENACAASFELIYRLLEKLELIKTGDCRITHCLHRPKVVCSSAQTELAGGLPPLITTDSWEPENAGTTSAVKRFFNIGHPLPNSLENNNGFVRVTADSRSLSNDLKESWRTASAPERRLDQLMLDPPANDLHHAISMEALSQHPERTRSNSRELIITAKLDIPFVANPLARRHSMQIKEQSKQTAASANKAAAASPPPSAPPPTPPTRASRSNPTASPSSPRLTVSRQQPPLLAVNNSLQVALSNRRKSFNTVTDAVTSLFQKK